MISLEDCVALCGLTEEEVLAIAEHEQLPEIAATALAQYLLKQTTADEATATTRDGVSSHRSSRCDSSELENQ